MRNNRMLQLDMSNNRIIKLKKYHFDYITQSKKNIFYLTPNSIYRMTTSITYRKILIQSVYLPFTSTSDNTIIFLTFESDPLLSL